MTDMLSTATEPDTPHAGSVPSFAIISGKQVEQALGGREKDLVDLVEATYRLHGAGLGQSAVVLPALPRPSDGPDHRAARLHRRPGAGGRPEVDLRVSPTTCGPGCPGPPRC
ncbi:hypothetical protein SCANM63S_05956 [Streptomyces canarius]